jgi:hypothetical protein
MELTVSRPQLKSDSFALNLPEMAVSLGKGYSAPTSEKAV